MSYIQNHEPEVWKSYLETGSVHATGDKFGVAGETVRRLFLKHGRKINNPYWSESEIGMLTAAYGNGGVVDLKLLSEQLGRSHAGVACKAEELGFTARRGKHKRKRIARKRPLLSGGGTRSRWSDQEIQLLRDAKVLSKQVIAGISEITGRSANSIATTASKLGITKQKPKEVFNKVCKQCGSLFQVQSKSLNSARKFCTIQCAYANKERSWRPKKDYGKGVCRGCGLEFSRDKRSPFKRFCTQKCAASFNGKVSIRKIPRPQATKWDRHECAECGKEFHAWRASRRKFCSRKCAAPTAIAKAMKANHANGNYTSAKCFSRCKRGERQDIGITVRSAWEANYARYLNFLIQHEGKIERWEYEPETFWFEAIKRGCRSYKPDFKVYFKDGTIEFHEVKGWMYPRARTALKRMAKYHPEVKVVLIDQHRYKAIAKTVKHIIKNWE